MALRKKELMLVVTFYTTSEAMAVERLCKDKGYPGKLFSAPRNLSVDCGIAWKMPLEYEASLRQLINEEDLEIHGIHKMDV
ncbi:MAG: DUF3343 domain-containing protein [Blautia sp.]|nr:DUF3343 domain-containing protein [Blautia sp.]